MRRYLTYGIFIGLVASFVGLSYLYYLNIEKVMATPLTSWEVDHQADCAVVLTGERSRIPDGIEQLYLKRVKKLIISGVFPNTHLKDLFPNRFYYGSLDINDVILEKRSLTTYGNAVQSLLLVNALHCRDVVLITSRLHMYRAYRTFRSQFPDEIQIYQRATVGSRLHPHWTKIGLESLKALFYDLWLY